MLALVNGRLIDGTGRDPIERAVILVDRNRVRSVGPQIIVPEGVIVIELDGLTIMPGLIDCHLHLGGFIIDKPGRPVGQISLFDFIPFLWDYFHNFAKRRRLAVENGVTTIRSAGDNYPHITQLRDKIESGRLTGPRIVTPGPIFTAPGGHPAGTIYKRNRYIVEHATRQVSDTESAREEVRKLVEGKVDCIKAVYTDIDPMDISHKVPKLSFNVLGALANEAHKHNLRLMVHTGGPKETIEAVKAGADSIEHGILPGGDSTEFDDELVKMMLDKGTYFVPTIAIAWAYKEIYPAVFSSLKRTLKKLHDAGVNIAAGTDSGTPGVVIGKGLHKELELMTEAGLSPMDAIVTATRNAAENLGKMSELGTIEEGKLADMIVVSGDPLEDISNTRCISLMMKNGKILVDGLNRPAQS